MGKATGFLEYQRKQADTEKPLKRIRHFGEFRTSLALEEQQKQGGRCMECRGSFLPERGNAGRYGVRLPPSQSGAGNQ